MIGRRVLIVDDASFMRKMLKEILEKNGYEIAGEAENGNEALDKFKELNPDIVTLDITMPGIDGLAALKIIKEENPRTVCIMCSAINAKDTLITALKYGADDFVVKPFQPERLLEALRKAG